MKACRPIETIVWLVVATLAATTTTTICGVVVVVKAEPHPHNGVVKPFASGDPGVSLNRHALAILKSGKPYQTQTQKNGNSAAAAGRGLVVQDVLAPVDVVWSRILDFDAYPKMVPKTVDSQTYKVENNVGGKKKRIFVRMKVGFPPVLQLQFYINHLYDPAKKSLTWTLDYSHKSDLNDSAGYWYILPHPDNPTQWTRVYYSVEVSLFPWVPRFVVDFMSKQALTDATAWVKKYSELNAAAAAGKQAQQQQQQQHQSSWVAAGRGAAGDTSVEKPNRKHPWLSSWLPGVGQHTAPLEEKTNTPVVALTSTPQPGVRPIGWTRASLVLTVWSLALYNIHLYFSQ